ncbi:testis-expressed protein 10 homolog [Watersipora subatra]|uniref:testis-expressed protein 10 homolog n=1 Tax=Watersipora subatra TaxID=2589382 RepID=UPI00355C49B7
MSLKFNNNLNVHAMLMPKRKVKKNNDFQKVKFKVGKKLPKAENVTSTAFKSKAIVIKEQLKETSADDLRQGIFRKSRDPQELLTHLQHYNPSFRLNALNTIKAIMTSDPCKLLLYMGSVLDKVSALSSDTEKVIRAAALDCLKTIFGSLNANSVVALIPTVTAHLRCAMTHLNESVKLDSLQYLDLLVSHYPQAINQDLFKLTQNFLDLISTRGDKGNRSLKVSPSSKLSTIKWRQQAFDHLDKLLSIEGGQVVSQSHTQHSGQVTNVFKTESCTVNRQVNDAMYLSTAGLEQVLLRKYDLGCDEDVGRSLQVFVRELMPLLGETWVELVTDGAVVGADAHLTLLSVTNIIKHLYRMVRSSEIKDPEPTIQLLRADVRNYISNGFPIASIDRKSGKNKPKNTSSQPANHGTSIMLNVELCSLASVLGCSNHKTQSYMLDFLESSNLSLLNDQLETIISNLQPGILLEGSIVHMIEGQRLSAERIAVIVSALDRLVKGAERLSESLVVAISSLSVRSEMTVPLLTSLLAVINGACLTSKMVLSEALIITFIKECVRCAERSKPCLDDLLHMLRLVISLLEHTDRITTDGLRAVQLLQLLHGDSHCLVSLLLHILNRRACSGGLANELYISFLISLLSEGMDRDTPEPVKYRPVLEHICYVSPNPEQIANVMEYHYTNKMDKEGRLSAALCCILLGSQILRYFSSNFIAELIVSYLIHAADIQGEVRPDAAQQLSVQSFLTPAVTISPDIPDAVRTRLKKRLDMNTNKERYGQAILLTRNFEWSCEDCQIG